MTQLSIQKISKSFHNTNTTLKVLDQVNLEIKPSSCITIEGRSGSGKSTFLNILGTLEAPSNGKLFYGDLQLNNLSESEKEKFRSKVLGFIFQHHYLLPDFTILENVMMPLLINKKKWKEAKEESEQLLSQVGLIERVSHYPYQISGGEMARVGVARALVGEKKIILADEPTGNLDTKNSEKIIKLILELQSKFHFTLILVTHDQNIARHFQYRYELQLGKLSLL